MDSLIKFVDFIKDFDYVDGNFLNVDFVYFIYSISGSTTSYDNSAFKNCPY